MRGKESRTELLQHRKGITPAYAGKRATGFLALYYYQDHPRLCGEKVTVRKPAMLSRGSPPPMRGKAEEKEMKVKIFGITPAYAGKRDHPLCSWQNG